MQIGVCLQDCRWYTQYTSIDAYCGKYPLLYVYTFVSYLRCVCFFIAQSSLARCEEKQDYETRDIKFFTFILLLDLIRELCMWFTRASCLPACSDFIKPVLIRLIVCLKQKKKQNHTKCSFHKRLFFCWQRTNKREHSSSHETNKNNKNKTYEYRFQWKEQHTILLLRFK